MHLQRAGAVVAGLYYYTKHWVPLLLRGEWRGEGDLRLTEQTSDGTKTGVLEGVLGGGGFKGSWSRPDSSKRWPVQLRSVRQTGCNTFGAWKQFDDPAWPFTFSYPATWHLEQQKDGWVRLSCPDPEPMLFEDGGVVQIGRGEGLAPFQDGGYGFTVCRRRWFINTADQGGCVCDDLDAMCVPVTPAQRGGLTVIEGGGDDRNYCRGGHYAGQGTHESRLFLRGDRWLVLDASDVATDALVRIAKTVEARASTP
jgi:hypothetical protein